MRKRLTTNLGLKILAFLVAALMWLIVVNIDDPIINQTYSGIQVNVINEEIVTDSDRTYQIVDDTQEVSVTVTAKRSVLTKIEAEDITATADMKELTLDTQIPIEVSINGFSGKYVSAYSTPRNLQVKIEDEAKNNFPVTASSIGTVRDGYTIGELSVDPEQVTFRGPKTIIDSISKVVAEVDVSGLSDDATLEASLVLYDANNNVVDQTRLANNLGKDGISVKVTLNQVKTVSVVADDSMITAAEGYTISDITAEPQTLDVSGSEEELTGFDEIEIPAEALEATDITESYETNVDIAEYLPKGVSLVDPNASSVIISVTVEQPGAKTYEVSTNSITVNDLADTLELSYATVDLEVQIRGPSEVLNTFSIAKKVSIDLMDYTEPGNYTVPVTVELPEGCSLAGDLSVDVILEKKSAEENNGG